MGWFRYLGTQGYGRFDQANIDRNAIIEQKAKKWIFFHPIQGADILEPSGNGEFHFALPLREGSQFEYLYNAHDDVDKILLRVGIFVCNLTTSLPPKLSDDVAAIGMTITELRLSSDTEGYIKLGLKTPLISNLVDGGVYEWDSLAEIAVAWSGVEFSEYPVPNVVDETISLRQERSSMARASGIRIF
jgi:hypothetical protein